MTVVTWVLVCCPRLVHLHPAAAVSSVGVDAADADAKAVTVGKAMIVLN